MPYIETKVYFDGSHYIGIPHTENPYSKRSKAKKSSTQVNERDEDKSLNTGLSMEFNEVFPSDVPKEQDAYVEPPERPPDETMREASDPAPKPALTAREVFEQAYSDSIGMNKYKRRAFLLSKVESFFPSEEHAKNFVFIQMQRKARNMCSRKVRLWRKINLQEFNYFCTFTYDDAKHTEETFRVKLGDCLSKLSYRKGWKYIGVWERSPEKQRLHFHGIFYIPDESMLNLTPYRDYNVRDHCMQITYQDTYFLTRFGRCDFEKIDERREIGSMIQYMVKYLEKSGEKLIYSKGLPQYFISDILDEDVAGRIGMEDKKLLLFDDFTCYDQGMLVGKVSADTISKLRKSN